jgi:cytoskeletal protein CcmA (bactofilin family)
MKKRILWLAGLLAGLLILISGGIASAHSFRAGTNVTTSRSEKIDHSLFIAGGTLDIGSEVNGDVFCAGQTVSVSGTVHGDVICAGQTVTVSGTVDGNVRLAGQTVTLNAKVGGSATIAGQTFSMASDASIGRDLTLGSTNASVNGNVGRDIAGGVQNLTLGSTVGRDVQANIANLTLDNGANIKGNLTYTSFNDVKKNGGAQVAGTTTRRQPKAKQQSRSLAVFGFSIAAFIYWLLALVFMTFMLALALPRTMHEAAEAALPWPWRAMLVGFLASLAVPVVFIIFAATVIGLPLAFVILFAWFVVNITGIAFGAYYAGRLILRDSTKPLLIALVGAAALTVLLFIPVLGIIALVAAAWIGEGLVLMSIRKHLRKPEYNLAKGGK